MIDSNPERARENLLRESMEKVEMRAIWALHHGAEEPTVLVLDPRDEDARAIAETSGEGVRIEDHIAESLRRGAMPVLSWGLPRRLARDLVVAQCPEARGLIDAARVDEGYLAIVVAAGGISIFAMPPVPA
jgi:hypothetical protein